MLFTFFKWLEKTKEKYFMTHEKLYEIQISARKINVVGTQPCSFIYNLPMAAFLQPQQS